MHIDIDLIVCRFDFCCSFGGRNRSPSMSEKGGEENLVYEEYVKTLLFFLAETNRP